MARDPDKAFFGHPRGLSTLFFTEMWERLSYYGARTFLAIYMGTQIGRGGRGMSDAAVGTVMALYLSSVYLLSLPGGWVADRFLGQRRAVTLGGIGIMLGNAMLAMPVDALFYPGLVVIALGTGLLKPNVSTIVGQLYKPDDGRRDAGFTIYYMGINIGAFFAPFIGMFLAQSEGFRIFLANHGLDPNQCWHVAFAVPALGMAFGIVQYLAGYKKLGEAGLHPTIPDDPKKAAADRVRLGVIVAFLVLVTAGVYAINEFITPISKDTLQNGFGIGLIIAAIGVFVVFFKAARNADETKKTIAMIPLFVGAVAFFMVFEQASTTMSLFAERLVHREYLGMHIVASAYQFINAAFILILAPVFAAIWMILLRKGKEPSSVNKFAIGTVFTLLSILILLPTVSTITQVEGLNPNYWFAFPFRSVSPNYLIVFYIVSTCSELCISPVGLSSMSKLAPARLAGMVMGTWFLAAAIGNYLAGRAAQLSSANGYGFLFWLLIIASGVIAVALFLIAPRVKRMLASSAPEIPKAVVVESSGGDA